MDSVGIVVLDAGYGTAQPTDPSIQVVPHDFRPYAKEGEYSDWGVPLRHDGTDSVPNGAGTVNCDLIASYLRHTPLKDKFRVFAVKAGDSGQGMNGVDVWAIQPALRWVLTLPKAYPTWGWVAYLNWTLPAVGQERPVLQELADAGIPLVIPAGDYGLDCDPLLSGGAVISTYLQPHVLAVASCDNFGNLGRSDYGLKTVQLAVPSEKSWQAAATAAAWVAVSRLSLPNGSAADVVGRVKGLTAPAPPLKGKVATGGLLAGVPM